MQRISKAQLERMVDLINATTQSPPTPYTRQADGRYQPNAFNHHLDWAYGGVALCQMCREGTGTRTIIARGTKRELYEQMRAYLGGIDAGKNAEEPNHGN